LTAVQRIADGFKQMYVTARPWSRESIAARNRDQAEMLRDYIRPNDKVLDVGCGTAYLTECVAELFGADVMGLDVQDIRVAQIPFHQFDGTSIPFPDQSFDHVVLSFTLHHCHEPLALIQECRRVARRTVLAFEDLPDGAFGRRLVNLHVEAFRLQYRLKLRGGDYRSALAWLDNQAEKVIRTPLPYEWFDRLYVPRYLLAYMLSER
jgi:ubiquinone/menaquinone biosynthesis C-methylase UbiE